MHFFHQPLPLFTLFHQTLQMTRLESSISKGESAFIWHGMGQVIEKSHCSSRKAFLDSARMQQIPAIRQSFTGPFLVSDWFPSSGDFKFVKKKIQHRSRRYSNRETVHSSSPDSSLAGNRKDDLNCSFFFATDPNFEGGLPLNGVTFKTNQFAVLIRRGSRFVEISRSLLGNEDPNPREIEKYLRQLSRLTNLLVDAEGVHCSKSNARDWREPVTLENVKTSDVRRKEECVDSQALRLRISQVMEELQMLSYNAPFKLLLPSIPNQQSRRFEKPFQTIQGAGGAVDTNPSKWGVRADQGSKLISKLKSEDLEKRDDNFWNESQVEPAIQTEILSPRPVIFQNGPNIVNSKSGSEFHETAANELDIRGFEEQVLDQLAGARRLLGVAQATPADISAMDNTASGLASSAARLAQLLRSRGGGDLGREKAMRLQSLRRQVENAEELLRALRYNLPSPSLLSSLLSRSARSPGGGGKSPSPPTQLPRSGSRPLPRNLNQARCTPLSYPRRCHQTRKCSSSTCFCRREGSRDDIRHALLWHAVFSDCDVFSVFVGWDMLDKKAAE
jgi:hypothetical protein